MNFSLVAIFISRFDFLAVRRITALLGAARDVSPRLKGFARRSFRVFSFA